MPIAAVAIWMIPTETNRERRERSVRFIDACNRIGDGRGREIQYVVPIRVLQPWLHSSHPQANKLMIAWLELEKQIHYSQQKLDDVKAGIERLGA